MSDPTRLPDLASRALGGAVVAANDESFAAKENLVLPHPAQALPGFGHRGKEYDGWETRRRRSPGSDWAIVRLGVPGIVSVVVVDTAHFTGNFPPQASVECAAVEGHPTVAELERADWQPLLPLSDLAGDAANTFPVDSARRVTHVRLTIAPDGGVARLRVHGTAVPDPRLLDAGPVDLAALENGALVTGVSDAFYGRPVQLVSPGLARSMGEGWETRRRRGEGNDWVELSLACEGVVTLAELDTSYFLGNAPGSASLTGSGPDGEVVVLPRTRLQPDTRHRFVLDGGPGAGGPAGGRGGAGRGRPAGRGPPPGRGPAPAGGPAGAGARAVSEAVRCTGGRR